MGRVIKRKGRPAQIRQLKEKRAAQAAAAAESSQKRPRTGPFDDDDDNDAFFDAPDMFGGVGDDFESEGEAIGANDFDEAELARSLFEAANDDAATIIEDRDGGLRFAEDDGPTREEAIALADYQLVDEPDEHDDEADWVDEEDDDTIASSSTEPATKPVRPSELGRDVPIDESAADDPVRDVMVVAAPDRVGGAEPSSPFAGSKPIDKQRRKDHGLNDFAKALGIFCITNKISRKQYVALKQILGLLRKGEGLAKLNQLPASVDTLTRQAREELPSIEIRSKEVALNPKKLSATRQVSSLMSSQPPSQDLYFFNPIDMFGRILSSNLSKTMHFGLAHLVDNPSEAWHGQQWAGTIRAASGELPFYPSAQAADDQPDPIFPGDVIDFQCGILSCRCRSTGGPHQGQVLGVYRDFRSSRRLGETSNTTLDVDIMPEGEVVLQVARIMAGSRLIRANRDSNITVQINPLKSTDLYKNEQLLVIDPVEYVDAKRVLGRIDTIAFDYSFGSQVQFDSDPEASTQNPLVRRAYHAGQSYFLPLCKVTPVPGSLEIAQWGRDELVQKFSRSDKVRSVPLYNFNDGFGLYGTLRKSIMGVYLQPVALPKAEHTRPINVLPLTLGPHASNFQDVTKAMAAMRILEQGIVIKVNGEDTLVCTPIIAFIGDMVQQLENSGCMGVGATLSCRHCEVRSEERGDLQHDIINTRRAHHEMVRLRRALEETSTKSDKKNFASAHGISLERPSVLNLAPSLDLIAGRPNDPAHSDLGGITKMAHQLLLDVALKPNAAVEYAKVLRRMPFPPGWSHIQSPYHVLSYGLAEHSRWALLMVVISLFWLKEDHLKPAFVRAMKTVFSDELSRDKGIADILTIFFARLVKSNSLLTAPQIESACRDRDVFMGIVTEPRRLFQRLCEAANLAAGPARGAAAHKAAIRAGSMAPPPFPGRSTRASSVATSAAGEAEEIDVLPSIEEEVADDINIGQLSKSQKAIKYSQWASRPNVHTGLHYFDDLARFGVPSLQMVLAGEMKHKEPKLVALHSNHRNPEKDYLLHEDLKQAVRLTLADGFQHDEPEMTANLKALAAAVPAVFDSLLPVDAPEDDVDTASSVSGDSTHVEPRVLVRIAAGTCKAQQLPVREKQLTPAVESMLLNAYSTDYGKDSIIITSNGPIFWWKKLSFAKNNNTNVRRSFFERGHYVTFRDSKIGRLDHIFTHEALARSGTSYVFLVITPVESIGQNEPLTDLPILKPQAGKSITQATDVHEESSQVIVGLPALSPEKSYIVPYEAGNKTMVAADKEIPSDCELLHVNWRIHSHA